MKYLTIGYIGNFIPPESTENHRKWSFEQLGHKVIEFQENQTKSWELISWMKGLDVLFYSHTHSPDYIIPGLIDVFRQYKEAGVPTASLHLDLWRNLKRWEDVGKEATWNAEYVFTPDNTGEWPEGINHHYLMPGVVGKYCYFAKPDHKKYPHEIIFVGSRGYHPESYMRPQLIDWLKKEYGNWFGHYGNDGIAVVRGDELNVLLASAKIVVGDSCFANQPGQQIKGYWSDRIPEITGRGGMLLHPEIQDCPHNGVAWYKPGDFADLKEKIDFYLNNREEREIKRIVGQDWTKNNATYTHRSREILERIFE